MHGTRKMGSQCSWLAGVEGKAGHGDIWGCVSTETGLSATHTVWSFSPCLPAGCFHRVHHPMLAWGVQKEKK